jgi:hypothetical protein
VTSVDHRFDEIGVACPRAMELRNRQRNWNANSLYPRAQFLSAIPLKKSAIERIRSQDEADAGMSPNCCIR